MTKIYVDSDACPVKDEVARVAARHGLQVYLVSNQGMRNSYGPHVQGVMVGSEFDAADNWIAEHIIAGDIAITADIQLAARCLKKDAAVINHTGKLFTADNIGQTLAMRELSSYLREAGEINGGNAPFSKQDRSQFLQSLDMIIQKEIRKA